MIRLLDPRGNEEDKKLFAESIRRISNHKDHLRWLTITLNPYSEESIQKWIDISEEEGLSTYIHFDEEGGINGKLVMKFDNITGCTLMALGLIPEAKGKGIGKKLVNYAVELAKERGYKAIKTETYCDNKNMLLLAISCGFIPIRILHHHRDDGGDMLELKKYFNS